MRTLIAIFTMCGVAAAQPAPAKKISLGIYAPTIEFGGATPRLAYVKALASAIEQNTGLEVDAQTYANLGALVKGNVDFAIVDGPCYATNLGWRLLATANVGGDTQRAWALFSGAGDNMQALKGKRIAFVAMGCNDTGFVDNAMLGSEVDTGFFGVRVGKQDLTGAIAEVASYKTAQGVFAPVSAAKGLAKVYDGGSVPNPAFVALATKLPAATIDKVAAAVIGYGGGGAIAGWTKPARDIYVGFAGRLAKVTKSGVMATPDAPRLVTEGKDLIVEPPTLRDTGLVNVRHLFVRAPAARLE